MSLNFSINEEGDSIMATFPEDNNSLRAVGQYFIPDSVRVAVEKRVSELNLISSALKCLESFNNCEGLTADLVTLRESREFADKYQEFVNDYTAFGFNLRDLEILTYAHFSRIREWNRMAMAVRGGQNEFVPQMRIPHRPAPPIPAFLHEDAARPTISRPTVPPPPPPPPSQQSQASQPSVRPKTRPPADQEASGLLRPPPPPTPSVRSGMLGDFLSFR